MNNVPHGTTLYYLAGISTALHIRSLVTMSSASAGRHTSALSLSGVDARVCELCRLGKHKWERGGWSHFRGEYVC